LLVDGRLRDARAALKGQLRNGDLKRAFAPDNSDVVAILLVITHSDRRVKEVKVYVTRRGQTGKILLRVLDDPRDNDFQTLVKVLRLGRV
jgi:hypothetical protein